MKILYTIFALTQASLPVVLWHGMGDNCCHSFSMGAVEKMIQKHAPGVNYIKSLMIGDSPTQDTTNGFLLPVNDQLEMVCKQLSDDLNLKNGYNAIGFSQGGQFLRGIAQKCPNPPMRNLISVGGQHQGIFGLPKCPGDYTICQYVAKLLDWGAYTNFVQSRLVQAQYWHDPLDETTYTKYSQFIARINCEGEICPFEYETNLKKLNKMVLIKFNQDTMVVPRESSHFGYYSPGQQTEISNMTELSVFTEDRIGLKTMLENDQIDFISTDGDHLQFSEDFFANEIVPYLN